MPGWFNNPGGLAPSPNPGARKSRLRIERPTEIPHQNFVGMSKEERRQVPQANEMFINYEDLPKLRIGFWQAKFKVGDHGAVHGLPFTVKDNGGTKTQRTNDNTLSMMRSIRDMPNRKGVELYKSGTYQGGRSREFDAIHLYDSETDVIAVFRADFCYHLSIATKRKRRIKKYR